MLSRVTATLTGTFGDDVIDGQAGDDKISGGSGNDHLIGGAGSDELNGGFGRDRLEGGADDDILIGGGDGDIFVFAAGSGNDTINGFGVGLDTFELQGALTIASREEVDTNNDSVNDSTLVHFSDGGSALLASVTGISPRRRTCSPDRDFPSSKLTLPGFSERGFSCRLAHLGHDGGPALRHM